MRSRRSSRVHEESAIKAAPLMMLSRRSSRDGRDRISSYARGSMIIFCWNGNSRKVNLADILCSRSKAAQSASDAIFSVELINGLPVGSGSLFWMQSFIWSIQMYLYTESPALYNHQRWFIVHLLLFKKSFYNVLFYVLFLQTGVHSPLQRSKQRIKQIKQTSASRHALTVLNKGSKYTYFHEMNGAGDCFQFHCHRVIDILSSRIKLVWVVFLCVQTMVWLSVLGIFNVCRC